MFSVSLKQSCICNLKFGNSCFVARQLSAISISQLYCGFLHLHLVFSFLSHLWLFFWSLIVQSWKPLSSFLRHLLMQLGFTQEKLKSSVRVTETETSETEVANCLNADMFDCNLFGFRIHELLQCISPDTRSILYSLHTGPVPVLLAGFWEWRDIRLYSLLYNTNFGDEGSTLYFYNINDFWHNNLIFNSESETQLR